MSHPSFLRPEVGNSCGRPALRLSSAPFWAHSLPPRWGPPGGRLFRSPEPFEGHQYPGLPHTSRIRMSVRETLECRLVKSSALPLVLPVQSFVAAVTLIWVPRATGVPPRASAANEPGTQKGCCFFKVKFYTCKWLCRESFLVVHSEFSKRLWNIWSVFFFSSHGFKWER